MRILLIGFGVVARSFAEIITEEAPKLDSEYGLRPRVVGIADSKGAAVLPEGIDLRKALEAKARDGSLASLGPRIYFDGMRALELIREAECEVVVEATPTELSKGEPGLTHVKAAIHEGRHVVCVNKGPLAVAMPALLELASHNGVALKFSGTVGGGTPVLDFAKKCLMGSTIRSISGILNGTTNYILTRMAAEGVSMKDALSEAQRLGYAEADPTYDISGLDTACKLVITSNYVLGTQISIRDVSVRGITEVTSEEIERAKAKGSVVKLLGCVDAEGARVAPAEIPATHPLNVSGTFNAISFDTHPAGQITLVGKGAGGKETASAVLRDIIEIRRMFTR